MQLQLSFLFLTSTIFNIIFLETNLISLFLLYSYCNTTLANYGYSSQSIIKDYLPNKFLPHTLCAGNDGGSDDECDGNSGGSLVLFNTRLFQYSLIGMSAGGVTSNCNDKDFPEVFIRLDHPEVFEFLVAKRDENLYPSKCSNPLFLIVESYLNDVMHISILLDPIPHLFRFYELSYQKNAFKVCIFTTATVFLQ